MSDVVGIAEQFIRGLSLVSDAITSAIRYVLGSFGLEVPDQAITVATIIFVILLIYKFGSAVNKIVLFALIFLLLSSFSGLIAPLLGML